MVWNEVTQLVERARAGDRAAYGHLVERFQHTVYALALARLRNPTDAQELVHHRNREHPLRVRRERAADGVVLDVLCDHDAFNEILMREDALAVDHRLHFGFAIRRRSIEDFLQLRSS